jgi:hypothetical protein
MAIINPSPNPPIGGPFARGPGYINSSYLGTPEVHQTCKEKIIKLSIQASIEIIPNQILYVWKSFPALLDALATAQTASLGEISPIAAWADWVDRHPREATIVQAKNTMVTSYTVHQFDVGDIVCTRNIYMKLHDVVMHNKELNKDFGSMYVAWTTGWC